MGKAGNVLLMSIIIFFSTLSLISLYTSAGPLTQVAVDPDSRELHVDVSPGSTGVTSTKINVACQTLDPTPVDVHLTVNCPGASAMIDPEEMVFQTMGVSNIEATLYVTVALETKASEMTCSVEGSWEQGIFSGQVSPASIQVVVMPYYEFRLSCDSPCNKTCQGEYGSFNFSIRNTGNCDDVYRLEVGNRDELKEYNISIPESDKIYINKEEAMKIEMDVRTHLTTPPGNYTLYMRVTSLGSETQSGSTNYKELPLILSVIEGLHTNEKTKSKGDGLILTPSILIMMVLIVYIIIALIYKSSR